MAHDYHGSDSVEWDWGDGTASGEVVERFTDDASREIDGTEVTRTASEDEPAYLIEQSDGQQVLKSVSELRGG